MLVINPPIVIASGVGGFGEYMHFIPPEYVGAYTLKTITYKPKSGNPPPRMRAGEFYILNSIGLENPGIERFLKDVKKGEFNHLFEKVKVIASLGGESKDEYLKISEKFSEISEKFEAVEFNFSCPNVEKGGLSIIENKQEWRDTLRLIREMLPNTFLIAKIGMEGIFVEKAVELIKTEGWDGVTLINTIRGLHIDADRNYVVGGLSGPILKPIALRMIYEVRKHFEDIFIIASGGVYTAEDAKEYLELGANAVAVGSALFKDPNVVEKIAKGLSDRIPRE